MELENFNLKEIEKWVLILTRMKYLQLQKKLKIINLVDTMQYYWKDTIAYPGNPYVHNAFRTKFSDHNPILFYINYTTDKD